MLGAGEILLYRVRKCDGGWRDDELLCFVRDLARAPASSSSMSLEGGLDILPDLVVYSAVSSVGDAVIIDGCTLPIRTVHWFLVGYFVP